MSETVSNTLTRLTTMIAEAYPGADVGPGSVIRELVLKLSASAQNEIYNELLELSQGKTLAQVELSGAGAYTTVMDKIASNYGVSREQGKYVSGKVKVYISAAVDVLLPEGFQFVQPSLNLYYTLEQAASVTANAATAAALGDISVYAEGSLSYFIVDVVAAEVGSKYAISSGTVLQLSSFGYIQNFVKAVAYGNFTGGLEKDDDLALLNKIKVDFGSNRLDSPAGIQTKLKQIYPTFQTLSACGAADSELLRDKQNALGIATLGKADIYVRTNVNAALLELVKTATKTAPGTWELQLDATDAPGFYKIVSVLPIDTSILLGGSLEVTNVEYGYSFTPTARNNEVNNATEARFTRYQTAKVTFNYSEVPTALVGAHQSLNVLVSHMPYVGDIQDMFLADDSRVLCADYLVKAALPCFVSLNISLVRKNIGDTVESLGLSALKQSIFNYVNTIPFGETLEASRIIDICHNYNIKRVDLPIEMHGAILCNDGTSLYIDSDDELIIPTNLAKGISPKTTQYFIDYYQSDAAGAQTIDSIGISLL